MALSEAGAAVVVVVVAWLVGVAAVVGVVAGGRVVVDTLFVDEVPADEEVEASPDVEAVVELAVPAVVVEEDDPADGAVDEGGRVDDPVDDPVDDGSVDDDVELDVEPDVDVEVAPGSEATTTVNGDRGWGAVVSVATPAAEPAASSPWAVAAAGSGRVPPASVPERSSRSTTSETATMATAATAPLKPIISRFWVRRLIGRANLSRCPQGRPTATAATQPGGRAPLLDRGAVVVWWSRHLPRQGQLRTVVADS